MLRYNSKNLAYGVYGKIYGKEVKPMKKVLAIVLALVMAFGCTAIAFAEDTYQCPTCKKYYDNMEDQRACIDKHESEEASSKAEEEAATATTAPIAKTCPYCGVNFYSDSSYDDHIQICYSQNAGVTNSYHNFINLTANQVLDLLHDFFDRDTDFWSVVSDIIIRLIDMIENLGTVAVDEADVAGAVDDLEAKVAELPIIGDALEYVTNLINTLKQKIKDLYAHDVETVAEEPVSTGSTSVGIVAFAAISVAAAAAYVCTKKKED